MGGSVGSGADVEDGCGKASGVTAAAVGEEGISPDEQAANKKMSKEKKTDFCMEIF